MHYTVQKLKELQALSLEDKIALTKLRITEWYERWEGAVYISFSGGKDSTVLLTIARQLYPDVKAVYVDTGLEFPEVKQHVKTFANVDIIRPKKSFKQVIEEFGWVFPSKEVAYDIYYARKGSQWALNKFNGLDNKGNVDKWKSRSKRWKNLVNAPFKISDRCCTIMKKNPAKDYEKSTKKKPIIGTLAEESSLRKNSWLANGCNAFDAKRPTSQPLSFWTEQDILNYIRKYDIKIPSVYGKIVNKANKLCCSGNDRTGCMFCLIGVHLEKHPNRFERMKITHPKIYEYCMNVLNMKPILDYISEYTGESDLY